MPSQWNVWRLTVFLGRCNWRDQQRLAVSYFSEYSTDFSVSNSGHEVLRRTFKDGKTGFEKRTVASSVCCFVGAHEQASKGGEGAFNGGRSEHDDHTKTPYARRTCLPFSSTMAHEPWILR